METPRPTHLDQRDPAGPSADIRAEVDAEIDYYAQDLHALVLLVPETRWAEFLRLSGAETNGDEARYRGVSLRKAAVTAVVAQEGF